MDVSVIFCATGITKPLQPALAALAMVFFGTPFNTEPYASATTQTNQSLLQTTQFVVIFDGLEYPGNGGGFMTTSGKNGLVGGPFYGYGKGSHGCDTWRLRDGTIRNVGDLGMFSHDYDPKNGIAKLNFYGQKFTIENDARLLRINGQTFALPNATIFPWSPDEGSPDDNRLWNLPKGRAVILVDAKGQARQGRQEDIDAVRKLVDGPFANPLTDPAAKEFRLKSKPVPINR